jgi:uncharacterized membrane protein YidH (DUF202 family)
MYALGITKVQGRLRWALVKQGEILRMEESDSIPEEVLLIKDLKVVTGLEGSSVIRRDVKLPLTSIRTAVAALPFQLETLLPFSPDQTVVFSQFYPSEKEMAATAWASTRAAVEAHLEKWRALAVDPDLISSETLALARYARHAFPNEPQLALLHHNLGLAVDHNRVVCAMESPDPVRLKSFIQQKYPLFTWIDQEIPFMVAIGLALEPFQKQPCQFRPKTSPSLRQKINERHLLKRAAGAGALLILATALTSMGLLHYQETKLKNKIAHFYQEPLHSLEAGINHFRGFIVKETKTCPPTLNLPSTQEVLAWLSTSTAAVEITHFAYELVTLKEAEVSLEFQAAVPSDADQFVKQLQQSPTFVESTHELKWTSHPQGYKLSFPLRKKF